MSEPRPSPARRLLGPALLLLGLLLGYHLTRPATVNGDGVGYLRQAMGQGLAPGHLAYLPLLRGLARLAPVSTPIELEPRARWLSLLAALLGLALFWDGARRLGSARTALFATGLLGISHAFARAAQEVEVYAVAALLALTCLWALLRLLGASARTAPFWVLLAGASCGLAILFHLTLALLAPSLLLLLWRLAPLHRARAVLLGGAALALVAGLPLLLALQLENRLHPAAAWAWLRSADHGLPYPHTLFTPLVALWGLCRSLVHAP